IVAHVNVLYDPRRVLAPKLVVARDLSAYVVAGAAKTERRGVGRARAIDYTVRMTCLDHPCLPGDPATGNSTDLFTLPSVEVDYDRPHAGAAAQQVPLPQIEITSRL